MNKTKFDAGNGKDVGVDGSTAKTGNGQRLNRCSATCQAEVLQRLERIRYSFYIASKSKLITKKELSVYISEGTGLMLKVKKVSPVSKCRD